MFSENTWNFLSLREHRYVIIIQENVIRQFRRKAFKIILKRYHGTIKLQHCNAISKMISLCVVIFICHDENGRKTRILLRKRMTLASLVRKPPEDSDHQQSPREAR